MVFIPPKSAQVNFLWGKTDVRTAIEQFYTPQKLLYRKTNFWGGGAEFAGPENDGPKKIKDWKMQDLENDGRKRWKMTDQIAGLENAGPGK